MLLLCVLRACLRRSFSKQVATSSRVAATVVVAISSRVDTAVVAMAVATKQPLSLSALGRAAVLVEDSTDGVGAGTAVRSSV
jgi:hypothetical protein